MIKHRAIGQPSCVIHVDPPLGIRLSTCAGFEFCQKNAIRQFTGMWLRFFLYQKIVFGRERSLAFWLREGCIDVRLMLRQHLLDASIAEGQRLALISRAQPFNQRIEL